jgi:putative intracellular protease/amidase
LFNTETKGDNTMTERRRKIAALVADAFQEEEYFFPKVALNEAGYQVEVVSSHKEPVEIYSYFARTGLLDVDRAIADARPEDYVGVLVPGGAKSPALFAEDSRVIKFVQDVSARGGVIACVCTFMGHHAVVNLATAIFHMTPMGRGRASKTKA